MTTQPPSDPSPAIPPAQAPPEADRPLLHAAAERHADLAHLLAITGPAADALQDHDLVHDLRVASRRLEEVVKLMQPFLEKSAAAAIAASLKSLRRAMGDLRDSDVTREHLARWRMPAPVKHIAETLASKLEAQRETLATAAAQTITSASVQGAMLLLAQVLDAHNLPTSATDAEATLRKATLAALKKREKRVRKAFGRATTLQTPEALHDARIDIKKLRYVAELLADADRPGMKTRVKTLKRIQSLLGDHHDAHVILNLLQIHLHDSRPAAAGLAPAWRKWHKILQRDQARRAQQFFVFSYRWING